MYNEVSPEPPSDISVTNVEFSKMSNFTVPLDPVAFFNAMQANRQAVETASAIAQSQESR